MRTMMRLLRTSTVDSIYKLTFAVDPFQTPTDDVNKKGLPLGGLDV